MSNLRELVTRFDNILALEERESLAVLGGYIIGAVLEQPHELYSHNILVQEIDNLANRLEIEDGTPEQRQKDWDAIKTRVKALKSSLA